MKNIIITIIFFLLLLTVSSPNTVLADEYFDRYETNLSWNEQKALLGNFAIHLQKNPEYIGYIAFYVGEKDSLKKIQSLINKSVKFLTESMKIKKSRIVLINAGKREDSEIILQPVSKNYPPPRFY